jgi:hypothetical protein
LKIKFVGYFYKFNKGFPRFLDVLIGQKKPCWKAAAVVIKLFWKPTVFLKSERFQIAANKSYTNSPVY